MFHSNDTQVYSLDSQPAYLGLSSVQREEQVAVLSVRSNITSQLRESLPKGLSANKRAVIDRLITRWAQEAVG